MKRKLTMASMIILASLALTAQKKQYSSIAEAIYKGMILRSNPDTSQQKAEGFRPLL